MRALYVGLFGLTFASGGLFLVHYVRGEGFWIDFAAVYLIVLVVYTVWLFALLFSHDVRPRRYLRYGGQKIAVLVPCFNEAPELLERSLRSVVSSAGRKQVIVVDDGSTNGIRPLLRRLAFELGFTLHEFESNAGKREALHFAVTRLLDPDVEFVVTIDSDTVLDRDALVRVVEPLLDERIGAATGDVRLLNERQNVLTRMIGTYYWIGLNIYKQAQSVIRSVVCCSGCLAAYRASVLRSVIDDLTAQRFLGEPCTHSEDRHLTNLVLKRGLDVVYVPEAISWTETPATLRSFVRQQRRWKRGYIRESLFTVTYAWRTKPILWLQVLCWDLTAPFLSFGLRLGLIAMAIQEPRLLLTVVLPSWTVLMLVRYIFVPLRAWRKLPGLFLYMFFYECCLYWLSLWALVTVKNRSWVTRGEDQAAPATVF
jgi:hyaluronan synthase